MGKGGYISVILLMSMFVAGRLLKQPESRMLSKEELLDITEANAKHEMENYIYTDMDHDGDNELIGVYLDDRDFCQVWYCSSDGQTCALVYQDNSNADTCTIEVLDIGDETHVVLNINCLFGPWKNYSILALRDEQISCLLADEYGYVRMTDEGDIVLNVEAYDGMYDPEYGMYTHTWKDTYLFYDGSNYKEYGATEISEDMFLTYENALAIKDRIDGKWMQPDTELLKYSYYIRKNGIMHIQCDVYSDSGEIQYGYYTIRYKGNVLDEEPGEYNLGQMGTSFSDLEVVY